MTPSERNLLRAIAKQLFRHDLNNEELSRAFARFDQESQENAPVLLTDEEIDRIAQRIVKIVGAPVILKK